MGSDKLKIIVLSNDNAIRSKISSYLSNKKSILELEFADSIEDIEVIKTLKQSDIIIWPNDKAIQDIRDIYKMMNLNCRLICCQKELPERKILEELSIENIKFISFPIKAVEFSSMMQDLIEDHANKHDKNESESPCNMYPIQTNLLHSWGKYCPFNVFLKISECKYIKFLIEGSDEYTEILDKYINKGVKEFFITHNDYLILKEKLIEGPFNSSGDPTQHLKQVNVFLQNMLLSTGVSSEAIELADHLSSQVLRNFDEDTSLKAFLLDPMFEDNNQFCYNHAYLVSAVCAQLASLLGWNSQTITRKLVMASLLHDSSLDYPEVIIMHDLYPEKLKELDREEKDLVKYHGPTLANILIQHISIDTDVITIIKNSHESPDGTGYPLKTNVSNLNLQTGVFLLAHEFIVELYKVNFDSKEVDNLVLKIFEKYNRGHFEKIAKEFKNIFFKVRDSLVA